jgi:Flp pilus assembly protein CpaB
MQRPLARLAVLAAVVAAAGLASCRGESPTESALEHSLFASRDSSSGDSIPNDSIPNDSIPNDSIPNDSIPNDSIPNDSIPNDSIPPDTIPPDTIPPDTVPPDTIAPISAFDLTVRVVGADSLGDTLQTVLLQGARVTLLRFDSLPDSASVPNAILPARQTNRSGSVTFHRLLPAWYRVAVDPPSGSAYLAGSALVAPATTEHVPVQVLLLPSP